MESWTPPVTPGFPAPALPFETLAELRNFVTLASVLCSLAFGWFYRYDGKFPSIRKVGRGAWLSLLWILTFSKLCFLPILSCETQPVHWDKEPCLCLCIRADFQGRGQCVHSKRTPGTIRNNQVSTSPRGYRARQRYVGSFVLFLC